MCSCWESKGGYMRKLKEHEQQESHQTLHTRYESYYITSFSIFLFECELNVKLNIDWVTLVLLR